MNASSASTEYASDTTVDGDGDVSVFCISGGDGIGAGGATSYTPIRLTTTARRGDPEVALRAPSTPRLIVALVCCCGLATAAAAPARGEGELPPRIGDVEDSLAHDPSYKVRVDAAIVLGKLAQPRSVPALVSALRDDPHPSVRASAAYALGRFGAPAAREAVVEALRDPAPIVRHMAHEALRHLGGADESTPRERGEPAIRRRTAPKPSFEVKQMGDPEHRAGPVLRSHMRDFLVDQLRPFGDVAPGENRGTYAVDGVIKNLSLAASGRDVEVSCVVQLIVSRQPSGGVFLMTSGEAVVQRPKRQWRPEQRAGMEMQALEAAVRSASEDLVGRLNGP
jgi:hypothetical protein